MRLWNIKLLLCSLLLLTGCLPEKKSPSASFVEPVYSQQYRKGAITARVTLSETHIPTAGKIQLTIEVHGPADLEVTLPNLAAQIAPFTLVHRNLEPVVRSLPNGRFLYRWEWTLVPALPGTISFQPLEILAGATTIEIPPLTIHVVSLLPEGLEHLEIKDITAPLELLPEEAQRKQFGQIAAAILGVLILFLLLRVLIRRSKRIAQHSPHENAVQALENLSTDPLEKIQQLNEILLAFIEESFQIPLAGKTLKEVIQALPKKVFLGRRQPLEEYLSANEHARFSQRISTDFPKNFEAFVRQFISETPEQKSCA